MDPSNMCACNASYVCCGYRLLVFAVAMYPTISDRILRTRDYYCHFVPAENPKFVIALAFLGHHIPCIVIIVCYVIVYVEMRKLFKTRPGDKTKAKVKAKTKSNTVSVAPVTTITATVATAEPTPSTSKDHPTVDQTKPADNDKTNNGEPAAAVNDENRKPEQQKPKNEQPHQKQPQRQQKAQATAGAQASSDAKARADRERKSFVTLSYIVIGYVICWVPFHFVYDVSFIRPELVSDDLYTATFWLTYVNSGINPFLYAFSSADLRNAVVKMIKCRCTSK